jgi:hypothetical protein
LGCSGAKNCPQCSVAGAIRQATGSSGATLARAIRIVTCGAGVDASAPRPPCPATAGGGAR